ncbi:MAG TPA: single-stranded DNA-binding protein [Clostridiales bacterium]|jgi:single-strand DNA-binding protein|nr:single-stranded DNA-binding protein [Clostridiales bacterium]
MVNKAILMGRLTRDPELRHTQNNTPVTSFTLAVDRGVRKSDNPNVPTADFIDIVAWNHTAEFVSKWFFKGLLVAVVGRIQTRKWTDNEGRTRVAFEVVADEVHFAEPKRDRDSSSRGGFDRPPLPDEPARGIGSGFNTGFSDLTGDDDDELPF